MAINLPDAILAIGSLGTASFALVDCTKVAGGGVSRCGFGYVSHVLDRLFTARASKTDKSNPVGYAQVRSVLFANWLNGTALADQKSIAKTLIKLHLDANNAEHLAKVTGVDPVLLKSLAEKYVNGGTATPEELNVAGRFDLILTTLLDEGYQRADQMYRNSAKFLAIVISVLLALAGWLALPDSSVSFGVALIGGLLAAPLAPVSKDLASALQASTKMLQLLKK